MDQVVYRCGECILDSRNRRFTRAGREYPLEPKVFSVLIQLVMRPGELVTRDQLLDAVWGHRYVTPSTLNRVITLARRALREDGAAQKLIQTVHGAGYRYAGPIERAVSAPAEELIRFGPPPSARPPARLQTLIGREHELTQIDTLLRDVRALTVLGTGGMGKTQCALAFAHDQAARFPDGVWFFDLAPMLRADEWLQALALALSITPTGERELVAKIAQALAGRRALLLIDNCDRLSAGIGMLVVELLRGTDVLKILATSQQQLNFVGERVLRMPPLRLPAIKRPAGIAELQEVAEAGAVALLLARIGDAQTEFEMNLANAPAVVEICERLDGMPLALELAAARFALLSPDQVLERLDQRFRFLVSDLAGRDQRHRNLIALLEWSFGLLSTDEQRLLAWLGVFVQGWTVDAIIDIAPAFGGLPEGVVDLLGGLVSKSLVSVDQSVSPPRYRLLESVREFALEKLQLLGEEQRARDAHLHHVVRMTQAAHRDMLGGRMRERIALLMPEHGNIASASDYAIGVGNDRRGALCIAGQLTLYFKAHGAHAFAKRICERALAGTPPTRTRERAMALMCQGVDGVMGEKAAPEGALLEALSIALELGEAWTAAYSSGFLAMWSIHAGRAGEAGEHIERLERTASERDDDILRALAGFVRGWARLADDDIEKALAELRAVRNLGGDYHQYHFIDMYIGLALFRRGDLAAAAAQWHEAMRNAIAVGHVRGIAGSVEGCGYIAERLGRWEEAILCLSTAAQIRKRTGSPLFSFWNQHNQFTNAALRTALGNGRYDAAVTAAGGMREEDVLNQADALLCTFGAGAATRQ